MLRQPCNTDIYGNAAEPDSDPASRKFWFVALPRSSADGEDLAGTYAYDLVADCASGTCD